MTEFNFIKLPQRAKDITGLESGRLKVLRCVGRNKRGDLLWLCQCSCGNTHFDTSSHLKTKHTKSCGCWLSDCARTMGRANISHGLTDSEEYHSWRSMKSRCLNPNDKDYNDYHGLGVKICERWKNSFEAFYEDTGPRPTPGHSIDRFPDNSANYSCGKCEECIANRWRMNCRWATIKEQNRNRRDNFLIEWNGKTLCSTEWEEITGIADYTIRRRIMDGWSVQDSLTVPPSRENTKDKFVRKSLISIEID